MTTRGAHRTGPGTRRRLSPTGRVVQVAAVALSFIGVSVLVVTSSHAAFVAQTDSTANQVSSASVRLTDDDAGTAMFTSALGTLKPGTPLQRCITVTYDGTTDPLPVRLYMAAAPTGTLAPYLDLTVEIGTATGAPSGSCAGFTPTGTPLWTGTLDAFPGTHGSYDTGRTTWDPALGTESRTFRFGLAVQDVAAAQDRTTTFGFSWETRTG